MITGSRQRWDQGQSPEVRSCHGISENTDLWLDRCWAAAPRQRLARILFAFILAGAICFSRVLTGAAAVSAPQPNSGEDTWQNLAVDLERYCSSTNSSASDYLALKTQDSLASRVENLRKESWQEALPWLNRFLFVALSNSNASPRFRYRLAESSLFLRRPDDWRRDDEFRQHSFTNALAVLKVLDSIRAGIDPNFNEKKYPPNFEMPVELKQQGFILYGSDRSYTNSPIWSNAVIADKAMQRHYRDQMDLTKIYRLLLQDVLFLKTSAPAGLVYAQGLSNYLESTSLPVEDKNAILRKLTDLKR